MKPVNTPDRASGTALVLGSLAGIVTMTFHPSPSGMEEIVRLMAVVTFTHGLALASVPLNLFGFLGLTRRLAAAPVLAAGALVSFAFGSAAVLSAAALNGFALPALAERYAGAEGATLEAVRVVFFYNHALNAAFARIFMAATAVAVLGWSLALLRTRALARWIGVVGVVASLVGLGTLFGGVLGVDVHDFGLFVFGYAAWSILAGVTLWRPAAAAAGAEERR